MRPEVSTRRRRPVALAVLAGTIAFAAQGCTAATGVGPADQPRASSAPDTRVGLAAGWTDAGEAISNLELIAHEPRPDAFRNPADMNDFGFANTDIAFQDDLAFIGNYTGDPDRQWVTAEGEPVTSLESPTFARAPFTARRSFTLTPPEAKTSSRFRRVMSGNRARTKASRRRCAWSESTRKRCASFTSSALTKTPEVRRR